MAMTEWEKAQIERAKMRKNAAKEEAARLARLEGFDKSALEAAKKQEAAAYSVTEEYLSGGTAKINKGIGIWHYKAAAVPVPDEVADIVPAHRKGCGLVGGLPPGGGFDTLNTLFGCAATDRIDPRIPWGHEHTAAVRAFKQRHPEWAEAHASALKEIDTTYAALYRLRDDDFMAQFFRDAGATLEEKDTEIVRGAYGVYEQPILVIDVPTLEGVYVTRKGLELVYKARPKDSVERWKKLLATLKPMLHQIGFDAHNLDIRSDSGMNIVLAFSDKDAFADLEITSGFYDEEKGRSLLGVYEDGTEAWINWSGNSGAVVGGVPGSGKTASLMPVFAGLAGKAEIWAFDGKALGEDLAPLRHIARVFSNEGEIDTPVAALEHLASLIPQRLQAMKALGPAYNNFWNIPLDKRSGMKPIFLILDECQVWTDASGAVDKTEKEYVAKIFKYIRTLIQQARSAGIITVLTTQKPDAQTINTRIRDNCGLRVSFRTTTEPQAVTILGDLSDPSAPSPTKINPDFKGRGVMDSGRGLMYFQAGYKSNAELEEMLSRMEPVEDQTELAARLSGRKARTTPPPRHTEDTAHTNGNTAVFVVDADGESTRINGNDAPLVIDADLEENTDMDSIGTLDHLPPDLIAEAVHQVERERERRRATPAAEQPKKTEPTKAQPKPAPRTPNGRKEL